MYIEAHEQLLNVRAHKRFSPHPSSSDMKYINTSLSLAGNGIELVKTIKIMSRFGTQQNKNKTYIIQQQHQ